jgi:hypothetical protein
VRKEEDKGTAVTRELMTMEIENRREVKGMERSRRLRDEEMYGKKKESSKIKRRGRA